MKAGPSNRGPNARPRARRHTRADLPVIHDLQFPFAWIPRTRAELTTTKQLAYIEQECLAGLHHIIQGRQDTSRNTTQGENQNTGYRLRTKRIIFRKNMDSPLQPTSNKNRIGDIGVFKVSACSDAPMMHIGRIACSRQ